MVRVMTIVVALVLVGMTIGGFFWRQKEKVILWPLTKTPPAYELAALLEKNGITLPASPALLNGTIQATISGILVIFSPDKDLGTQVRALQLVLPRLKIEGRPAKEIDLRFTKVVVRY